MIESMLLPSKKSGGEVVIDINWKGAGQGSKQIVDHTGRTWIWQSPVSEARVVGSDRGPVWVNIGDRFAITPVTPDLELQGKNFTIETEFKPRTNSLIAIGGTGDNNRGITPGISITLNQYPTAWVQAFVQTEKSGYARLLPAAKYEENWVRAIVKREVGVGLTMDLYHDDIDPTTPFASHAIKDVDLGNGNGSWYLFGMPNSPGQWIYDGYLNFYKVTVED